MSYNLFEYRRKPQLLSDLLPWEALYAPGVVLNKDGSFQRTIRYRGPDLESSTKEGLVSVCCRLNNVFRRKGNGWVLHIEAQRNQCRKYPVSVFPDPVTELIDLERRAHFSSGQHYENEYFFTLVYLPPSEAAGKMEEFFIERDYQKDEAGYETYLKTFINETDQMLGMFREIMGQAEFLDDNATLTYLHTTVSTKRHPVKVWETPMYLDSYISDCPLVTGFEPVLGEREHKRYVRAISIKQFPGSSFPGIFDRLNKLPFEYRWITRFLCLDREDGIREIDNRQKKLFAKRSGMKSLIKGVMQPSGSEAPVDNPDALIKATDAAMALQELKEDLLSYGFYTMTVIVMDSKPEEVHAKAKALEEVINGLGFTTVNEKLNAAEAWLGAVPGLYRANIRRPLLNTLNLSHMFPVSAPWIGQEWNKHLNAPPLMQCQTPDRELFLFDPYDGDVPHTMIVGPTGAGKSVLLALMAAQYRRYPNSQVYIFDKDGSSRILTMGVNGDFYDLASEQEGALSFQPLAHVDQANERTWAGEEWLTEYLAGENYPLTPEKNNIIMEALVSLATNPENQRDISGLCGHIQDSELRAALKPLTVDGAYGRLFDARRDNLAYGRWQTFEMGQLMELKSAVAPTLSYLFHKLDQRFTGAPSLLILDECWVFLSNPVFADKIKDWLKTLRKKNVAVVFATQSLADIANSTIAPAIIESCMTKIYLPNATAQDQTSRPLYESFGLNAREIQLISQAIPKRQYYYKSRLGSRLFELALGPVALAYCGASKPQDQKMAQEIMANYGPEGFNEHWRGYKGITGRVEELRQLKQGIATIGVA